MLGVLCCPRSGDLVPAETPHALRHRVRSVRDQLSVQERVCDRQRVEEHHVEDDPPATFYIAPERHFAIVRLGVFDVRQELQAACQYDDPGLFTVVSAQAPWPFAIWPSTPLGKSVSASVFFGRWYSTV